MSPSGGRGARSSAGYISDSGFGSAVLLDEKKPKIDQRVWLELVAVASSLLRASPVRSYTSSENDASHQSASSMIAAVKGRCLET